ncbi:MAG: zinc ribbon domain-containing protein [Oscillochloridaceae bacterium]|nr:zinc ribbon domain-containing protein [Chloroflexaceae bacterium]MDW8391028.1 zinc ribbon domain-containing protein [Oscillochloridaceae bacterium]
MVERICPACQHGNPIENRFCGACGAALDRHDLVRRDEGAIMIAGQSIPLAQVKQVTRAVALGLAAVAAEAGIAWLRRRAERGDLAALAGDAITALQKAAPQPEAATPATPLGNAVTIVSERVVEVWEHGGLTRQIVEKHIWRREG